MDLKGQPVSPLYLLERFEIGIVHLDAERRVTGMNGYARRVLPVEEMQPFDRMVLSFHPERSQPKVGFLLDQAGECPISNPPPMAMIINIPERVLMIKVSRMSDGAGRPGGYVLVFHDITELVSGGDMPVMLPAAAPTGHRRLSRIPTVLQQRIALVDTDDVLSIQSDGHYTHVRTTGGTQFCNLNIGDLESRLDPQQFMRVHRGHIVNLHAVHGLRREGGRLLVELRGCDEAVPVSRTSTAGLLERLGVPATPAARAGTG
jgi:LytTR family transcriptional regulator, CO-responsive transcriptional regulator RcoM